jgi:hypothetical protein
MRKRKQMLEIRAWSFLLALQMAWIIPCAYDYTHKEPIEELVYGTEEDIIHWKDEEMVEHETEINIEEVGVESVTKPQAEEVKFYNVPLSEEIQLHVFAECEKYNIAPNLIFAIMWRESRFDEYAVSPHGAIGLMQVAPQWHWDRMERLGCHDLYNPYQNITVGIDYVAELKEENDDVIWVILAYRHGRDTATEMFEDNILTWYVVDILEKASELQREVEQ